MDATTSAAPAGFLSTPAAVAVIAASIAFGWNQVAEFLRHRRQQKLRRESLLIAFYAEVRTLENFLCMEAQRGLMCLQYECPIEIRTFRIPRDVYDANTAALGELGDSRLAADLVTLYAMAEYVSAKAKELESDGVPIGVAPLRYLQSLSDCLGAVIWTHAVLRERTGDLRAVSSQVSRQRVQTEHGEHLGVVEQLQREVGRRLKVAPRTASDDAGL